MTTDYGYWGVRDLGNGVKIAGYIDPEASKGLPEGYVLTPLIPATTCKGTNCTSFDGSPHSPECIAEHERATIVGAPSCLDHSQFRIGDRVRKLKGSAWQGCIVGFYTTKLTPEGYCVESESHPGSVQIYPADALTLVSTEASGGAIDDYDWSLPPDHVKKMMAVGDTLRPAPEEPKLLKAEDLVVNGHYNWTGQKERLIYIGKKWYGTGYWYQFALVNKPSEVWCEVLAEDMHRLEVTPPTPSDGLAPAMLDDDDPMWLVDAQIRGLLDGEGASEDHENVLKFLRSTGLSESVVTDMHVAIVNGKEKSKPKLPELPNAAPTPGYDKYQERCLRLRSALQWILNNMRGPLLMRT